MQIRCFLPLALVSASLLAQQPSAGPTALTIYNQDFAVARTQIDLDLHPGHNEVTTTQVTSQLEPDSVVLRDASGKSSFHILEQNYDAGVVDQQWLLQKYEGKTIDFQTGGGSMVNGKFVPGPTVPGKIIRAGTQNDGSVQSQPLIEVGGEMQFQLPGTPLFPATTDGLLLKPTLRWQISSEKDEKLSAELAYVTGGFSWEATYNIVVPESAGASTEDKADVLGWVTIHNQSGTEFPQARIKLMAGDVAKIVPQNFNGALKGRMYAMAQSVVVEPEVTQKAFDDFHLYDLNRQVTLKDRETKQVEFIRATGVPVTRKYVYDGAENIPGPIGDGAYTQGEFGNTSSKQVRVEQEFINSKKNHLGMPLPAGIMRFYRRDADGQMEFVGENSINHTPEDEKVKLSTGTAFDVTGERKRTEFRVSTSNNTIDESYTITVKNAKDKPVDVDVEEHLFRAANWDIVEKSTSFQKQDSSTVIFPITVPAHGNQVVSYTVHYTW
jgi:hypothetical protein